MKIICSGCGIHLGDEPSASFDDDEISHGLCKSCFNHFRAQVGVSLSEYIENFSEPVVAVTREGTINYANTKVLELLGKPPFGIQGLPGGNVFECKYARLPEGCGNTIHCSGCTIRKTVMDTVQTGKPHKKVKAYLYSYSDCEDRQMDLLISTEKKGGVVFLAIDDIKPSDQ